MSGSDVIIVLPGGGYRMHAPHEAEPVADWLDALGVATRVFRYPVGMRHPVPLEAVRATVRDARAAGARRVGLLGFSAGGHAAGMAALAPGATAADRVDAAILCYPVVSMLLPTHVGSRATLIGSGAGDTERAATSLERLVTPDSPPFFIWHTAEDDVVPPVHSYLLGQALAANGVAHELHMFPHGGHGLGFAQATPGAAEWPTLCEQWLRRSGWID